jgi:hypothetical protein
MGAMAGGEGLGCEEACGKQGGGGKGLRHLDILLSFSKTRHAECVDPCRDGRRLQRVSPGHGKILRDASGRCRSGWSKRQAGFLQVAAGFVPLTIDGVPRRKTHFQPWKLSDRLRLALRQGNDTIDAFAYEAKQEAASALGRIGKRLEDALEALKRHDETPNPNSDREDLLQEAADLTQALIIQREAFGLYASRDVQGFLWHSP